MTSRSYWNTIRTKTGKTADDFKRLAERKHFTEGGILKPSVRTGEVVEWLKEDFALGHGHALAVVAVLTGTTPPGYN